jgi:hypothetical protein
MSQYLIFLQNEAGEQLDGQIEFLAGGAPVGAAGLHPGGTTITSEDIPAGTDKFKFTSPGYGWFSTSNLYDSNTITLVKEVEPSKYVLIGGALVGSIWLLSRLKF